MGFTELNRQKALQHNRKKEIGAQKTYKKFIFILGFLFFFLFSYPVRAENIQKIRTYDENSHSAKIDNAKMELCFDEGDIIMKLIYQNGTSYETELIQGSDIIISDRKTIYFTRYDDQKTLIVRLDTETSKEKVIKSFDKSFYPVTEEFGPNLFLEHLDNNDLYYSLADFSKRAKDDQFKNFNVYRLDLKNGKNLLVAKNADYTTFVKDRLIYMKSEAFDDANLYSVKQNGKDKKTLDFLVSEYKIIKDKIYFIGSKTEHSGLFAFQTDLTFTKTDKISKKIKYKQNQDFNLIEISEKEVLYEIIDSQKGKVYQKKLKLNIK